MEEVEVVVAEAVARWRALPGPHWLEPRFCPCGAPVEVAPRRLCRQLIQKLARADQRCRAQACLDTAWLRTWPSRDGVVLDFACATAGHHRWHFAAQPRHGGWARRRRGRTALPLTPRRPHLRRDGPTAACLITADAQLAEWCRAAWAGVGGSGVWQTDSVRLAQRWLLAHPHCPLLLMDGADGWWCLDPRQSAPVEGTGGRRPEQADEVYRQVRKIFHHRVESAGRWRKTSPLPE